jgi:Tol biopolymer transport system component
VGGEPVPLFSFPSGTTNVISITSDGSNVAALRRDEQRVWGIWTGTLASGALRRYEPFPLAPTEFVNTPALSFSPDGRRLLLMWNPSAEGEQAWLLPYPPDPSNPPRRVLESLPSRAGTPQFSWLPDSRHVLVSTATTGMAARLYLADTESGRFRPLSDGTSTAFQLGPVVSPDGRRFIFSEVIPNFDIVTINVHNGQVTPLIATNRMEEMPAWSADGKKVVYVTDRNGDHEIWLHEPGKDDRPLVTPQHFPVGTTAFFMAPQLAPDGTRVMYLRVETDGRGATGARLWMSSIHGGAPVRLRERTARENPGSWSPDGAWYVYEETQADGTLTLQKVRTSGTTEPETLVTGLRSGSVPAWSPDGRWIMLGDGDVKLVAADGSHVRSLGVRDALCGFAQVPEHVYCFESAPGTRNFVERRFDGTARVITAVKQEHWPRVSAGPALRLSLSPDGETLLYSAGTERVELVLGEGLDGVDLP